MNQHNLSWSLAHLTARNKQKLLYLFWVWRLTSTAKCSMLIVKVSTHIEAFSSSWYSSFVRPADNGVWPVQRITEFRPFRRYSSFVRSSENGVSSVERWKDVLAESQTKSQSDFDTDLILSSSSLVQNQNQSQSDFDNLINLNSNSTCLLRTFSNHCAIFYAVNYFKPSKGHLVAVTLRITTSKFVEMPGTCLRLRSLEHLLSWSKPLSYYWQDLRCAL
jgi:hypothetical protein